MPENRVIIERLKSYADIQYPEDNYLMIMINAIELEMQALINEED